MKFTETHPSKYNKASDLNKAITLVMNYVEMMEIYGQDEAKPVLFFENARKGLVLNVTNGNTIAEKYGDEMDDWCGKPIVLYPDKTDFAGKRVDCIRLKIPAVAVVPAGVIGGETPGENVPAVTGLPDSIAADPDIPF